MDIILWRRKLYSDRQNLFQMTVYHRFRCEFLSAYHTIQSLIHVLWTNVLFKVLRPLIRDPTFSTMYIFNIASFNVVWPSSHTFDWTHLLLVFEKVMNRQSLEKTKTWILYERSDQANFFQSINLRDFDWKLTMILTDCNRQFHCLQLSIAQNNHS